MQGRCDEQEERGMHDTIDLEGAESSSRIVDNHALLGHDTEHHDPNTTMMASKMVGKLDLI